MTTRVAVLTPPGSGAIGVLAVHGPGAWTVIRDLFRTAGGGPVPEVPTGHRIWFGRFGDQSADEVVLTAHGPDQFELHCHGGRQVIGWLIEVLKTRGIKEAACADRPDRAFADPVAAAMLPFARTRRTAGILLDQATGAYQAALAAVRAGGPDSAAVAGMLRRNAGVGRHLVEPWRVAVAGPPNAGKSSLLNALAGFDRSVVSPIPGTTRDAVSVSLAFDGWPADLFDTAGLRETTEPVEREGVRRARTAVAESDLVVWVVDATGPRPPSAAVVADALDVRPAEVLVVFNKMDVAQVRADDLPEAARVSALTGAGVGDLAARIAAALVPEPPAPGEPVPFTPAECDRWS